MSETKLYRFSPLVWNYSILILISMAFILSDWVVLYSSFGDFILAFALLLLLFLGNIYISKTQLHYLSIPIAVIIITLILSYQFNDYWLSDKRVLLSTTKLLFYLFSTVIFYNFIRGKNLSGSFLLINNIFALLTIVIGIVLIITIYLGKAEIYHWVWSFTRQDNMSYFFVGNRDIVRARSLFSEPAHLGYYLNTVFYANVFSKKKSNLIVMTLLAIGILLTLSYSMIIIFCLTGLSYLFIKIIKRQIKWSNWYWIILGTVGVVILYFWDFINITIIQRTFNILNGSDGSAYNRIIESWMYVVEERLWFGNGIGHTPPVTNIFAYVLSDFGLIGLIPYIGFTFSILFKSIPVFVLFVLMNIAKGGYLNPTFWLFLLFVYNYGLSNEN